MILFIFLQATQGSSWMSSIMIVAVMAIMYFFMIRPQQQKQKKEAKFQSSINKGDKVVTIGGLHGKVSDLSEHTVTIQTSSGQLTFEKTALSMEMTTTVQSRDLKA